MSNRLWVLFILISGLKGWAFDFNHGKTIPEGKIYSNADVKSASFPKSVDLFMAKEKFIQHNPAEFTPTLARYDRTYTNMQGEVIFAKAGLKTQQIRFNHLYKLPEGRLIHFRHPRLHSVAIFFGQTINEKRAIYLAKKLNRHYTVKELQRNPWLEVLFEVTVQKVYANAETRRNVLKQVRNATEISRKYGGAVWETSKKSFLQAETCSNVLEEFLSKKAQEQTNSLSRCAISFVHGAYSVLNPLKLVRAGVDGIDTLSSKAFWSRAAKAVTNLSDTMKSIVKFAKSVWKAFDHMPTEEKTRYLCRAVPLLIAVVLTGGAAMGVKSLKGISIAKRLDMLSAPGVVGNIAKGVVGWRLGKEAGMAARAVAATSTSIGIRSNSMVNCGGEGQDVARCAIRQITDTDRVKTQYTCESATKVLHGVFGKPKEVEEPSQDPPMVVALPAQGKS